jgi:hypothetical protein
MCQRLFSEKPEQDCQRHGNENARGQGKVKGEISDLEDKITRQPAQMQFLEQGPAQAKDHEDNADDDQCFCHVLSVEEGFSPLNN